MNATLRSFWLIVRTDVRLVWRGWLGKFAQTFLNGGLLLTGFVLMQLLFALVLTLAPRASLESETMAWSCVTVLIFTSALSNMQLARPDGALLFSSPVPSSAILAARVASHALASVGGVVFFVLPAVNVYAVRFSAGYLAGYVTLLTLGLLGAAAAMAATLALTKLLGARRALNVIRITGFVLVALFIVALRLPEYRHSSVAMGISAALGRAATGVPMRYVAQAAQGQLLPLAGLLVTGFGASALMMRLLERTFLSGAQQEQSETRARPAQKAHRWTESFFRAAYLKELRLLWRDPLLLARLLPMLANLAPILLVFRNLGWLTLAPLSCALAQTLVLALTPLLAGGDEAWDLLRSSPIDELTARRCKLAAALTPPLVLAALMNVLLAAVGHPLAAVVAFVALLPGSVAAGWLLAAKITPSPRRGTVKRKGQENLGVSLLAFVLIGLVSAGIWALNADRTLLGVGLIGANWLASFLIFGLTALNETPEWKFEALRTEPRSE